jgi:S-adenosylmethionine:tRNA ribosyltransferase-isomerase
MHISEFHYDLPEELIAQHPLEHRDSSRMLVLDREKRRWLDSAFVILPDYLQSNDVLVLNNTRVFPARLPAQRYPTGGQVEILLVRETEPLVWEALVRPGSRLKKGALLQFGVSSLEAEILDEPGKEIRLLKFNSQQSLEAALEQIGEMPLPPYIKRSQRGSTEARERYQTVYATQRGAIAAPTAGLHFTSAVIEKIQERGTAVLEITLHVSYGTFEPVRVEQVEQHSVRPEFFEISPEVANEINARKASGGRVVAVGTTTTRALESATNSDELLEATRGNASLTITPGYQFRITDALLTNFHLPSSSLLLLVSAFAGTELTLDAYRHAVDARYRFYSYGDCMLII